MIEVNNVIGSIDDDKDPRYVADGDYQYALNIRNANSTGQQLGAIENVKGTLSIPVTLPPGQNLCIGDCSDIERKHLYFFLWNSGLRHTIYQYSYAQNSVVIILQSAVLNFLNTHYVVGARVIGNQLFFNDALNEPRRIDINETQAFVEPPAIWEFQSLGGYLADAILVGNTPPPFSVGDTIYVRRDFRGAWVDAEAVAPNPDSDPGFYYLADQWCHDPNPQVSGVHTIINIIGNWVVLDVTPTEIDNFFIAPFVVAGIGGVAYIHSASRLFNAPFLERYIKLYRPAPHFPACTKYDTDSSITANNLRGRLFQFKYRWVYRHGMKSHFSPICKTALPELEKALTPFGDYKSAYDNVINVWVDTGDTDVVGIEIAVRVMSDPADLDFYLLTYIDKQIDEVNSNTSYQLRFYGNEIFRALDVPDASQPMDYIPFRANDMCLLQDKRLAIGGMEEGFDHVEIAAKMDPQAGLGDSRGFEITNPFPDDAPDSTTVLWEARFPLNRIVQFNGSGDFLWGSNNYPGNSAIIYPGDPPNTGAVIFPGLLHPGAVVSENAWQVINFAQSLVPPSPSITSDGIFTFINVKMRISKSIWSNLGFAGPVRYTYLFPPSGGVAEFTSFLRYADPDNFGDSFFYVSKQYTKILNPVDNDVSVRDYFLTQIMAVDPLEQTFLIKIELNGAPGDALATWYYNLTVRLEAFDDNSGTLGIPYGNSAAGTNLYLRPRIMSMVLVPELSSAAPISNDLRDWYRLLGVNKLSIAAGTSSNRNQIGFKTGATHPIAIEYRDDVGRRWPLSPVGVQYISYFNENNGYGAYNVDLLIRISSAAPLGATHYQMMYAGNSTMSKWLQFEVQHVELNPVDGVIEVSLADRILLYNDYNNGSLTSGQGRSNISYTWSPGDRMRIMTLWGETAPENETPAPQYIDVEIIGETTLTDPDQGLTLLLEIDAVTPYLEDLNNNFYFGAGSVIEVYSPKLSASDEEQFYYEIGEVFKITNGQHWGNQLNQGPDTPGSNNNFAQILLKNVGDAYVNIRRKLPEGYGIEDSLPPPGLPKSKDRTLETSNYSDFYPSEGWGPGLPNRIDREAKREFKPNLIRFSDIYLAGTRVNNVNRFFEGNLSDEPDSTHGSIQRMLCPETTLTVFQELSTGAMPVRAQELTTGQGAGVLFRSDNVLGKINYYQGNFGISYHREALVYYGGAYYHPSTQNGQYMRLAQNGYFPISSFKRIDYFHDLFNFINKSRPKVRILSTYDVKYDELLVHIPDIFNLVSAPILGNVGDPAGVINQKVFDKVTMAFSEPKKGWTTYYSFWPDNMARHFNKLFSWKTGKFFIHDETTDYNSFHGEPQEDSKITLVFNSEPTATKFLQSMGMNSTTEPKEVVITTPYGAGQRTSLFEDDFRYMENQYYAAILRNELTPDVDNPVTEGEVMRGEYFIAEVTFGFERKFELFAVTLRNTKSEMTGR